MTAGTEDMNNLVPTQAEVNRERQRFFVGRQSNIPLNDKI